MNKYPTNTSHLFLLRKGLAEWAVKEDFHTVIYVQYGLNDFWQYIHTLILYFKNISKRIEGTVDTFIQQQFMGQYLSKVQKWYNICVVSR